MKLSTFDLNHVRALHFLLEEAHVARAARRLAIRPPPLPIPRIQMQVAWHPQQDGDPRYTWFRGLLHESVRSLGLADG